VTLNIINKYTHYISERAPELCITFYQNKKGILNILLSVWLLYVDIAN